MARAHDESRIKSDRVGKAWQRKKELARSEGKPLTSRCPEWLAIENGRYVVRQDRAEIVRRVFRETIEGYGRREIVRRLNADGIPAFRGKAGWQTSTVGKVLTGRTVLGEYQPHSGTYKGRNRKPEGDPIPDYYPAVVDEETYWRAQAAMQGRRQGAAGRRGDVGAHILRGLGRCGSCGAPMHIVNKGRPPKGGIYLACSAALRKAGCRNNRRWRVEGLERRLLTALGYVEAKAYEPLDDGAPAEAERLSALRGRLTDAEDRRKRLLRLAETGDEEAESRFGEVAADVKALRKELKAAEAEAAKAAADPGMSDRLSAAEALLGRMAEAEPDELRDLRIRLGELLRGLVERVECHEYGAVMILKPRLEIPQLFFSGPPPFGFKMEHGTTLMLIEDSADLLPDVLVDFVTFADMSVHAPPSRPGSPAQPDEPDAANAPRGA